MDRLEVFVFGLSQCHRILSADSNDPACSLDMPDAEGKGKDSVGTVLRTRSMDAMFLGGMAQRDTGSLEAAKGKKLKKDHTRHS